MVPQVFTYPRLSPCLADVGQFVRPKSQQFPSNKGSPCKLNFLHNGRPNAGESVSVNTEDSSLAGHNENFEVYKESYGERSSLFRLWTYSSSRFLRCDLGGVPFLIGSRSWRKSLVMKKQVEWSLDLLQNHSTWQ